MTPTKTKPKVSIQDRMRLKALNALDKVELEIDIMMENKGTVPSERVPFDMYKYLTTLEYSGRVVQYMKGFTSDIVEEIANKEKCDQLAEAYSFLSDRQKKKVIKFLNGLEDDIDKFCEAYKPVRKQKLKTPAQLVKKLPYLDTWEWEGDPKEVVYKSIDPEEIIRARSLFTYNSKSKKLTEFIGHLSVKGSRITGCDEITEKTLTDLTLLDKLIEGGNIIAQRFMGTIPRSKAKEGSSLITKNTLLIKVIK